MCWPIAPPSLYAFRKLFGSGCIWRVRCSFELVTLAALSVVLKVAVRMIGPSLSRHPICYSCAWEPTAIALHEFASSLSSSALRVSLTRHIFL
jgi:hypothetical protein